ncbi:wax ester/triacylglycerol synthase family O-acyltransferase [Halioglobus maricola]|uniref:diacylglycerol O-acyltransferase n=1 Tax=Halioglobus maricola TaxID=2601894 RepID=A0A5P9NLJ5_9GAMM|nr:wax ester/triacylglycerol synthase family O-acyltransferase [Halioglobus maricola]QFU76622.1 wax ester/triacylglycerol synthase family O-acyltransferase [Halioglobus maricola]
MEKLSAQDAAFLKMESSHCAFHVAGLMILKKPESASAGYLRRLAVKCGRLNELWSAFNKQLANPGDLANATWIIPEHFDPSLHVLHYALPEGGGMQALMQLVTRAHERALDRTRPLWELHIIEGLPRDRFAIYCKVHHALVDGVGAMKMMEGMFSTSPGTRLRFDKPGTPMPKRKPGSLFKRIGQARTGLLNQYRAVPELSKLIAHMGAEAIKGNEDVMRLPFSAPRTLFNTELDSRRSVVLCELPLKQVKRLGKRSGGSVNDVLLAVCGGALRAYLLEQQALPRASLIAGLPVSLKSDTPGEGNKLSYILSPFFTQERDPYKRLQRIIKVTSGAKKEMANLSVTAAEDFFAMVMVPTILLSNSGNATRVRPVINAIFSNVPGAKEKLYLDGSELESIYPLSVLTDAMGLNITVVSHANKLCFAIASCPKDQPRIHTLEALLKASYRELRDAVA